MPNELDILRRSLQAYKGLVEISRLINSITDYETLLTEVLEVARRVARAEASSLFLRNPENDELELVIARGPDGEFERAHVIIPRGTGIAGWTMEHGEGVLVPDAYADDRFYRAVDKKSGFKTRSILCVPLLRDHDKIGVLQVLNPVEKTSFDATDLEVFQAYADLVVTAIEKLRTEQQQRAQERLMVDLELASQIQRSFLPHKMPVLAEAEFATFYRPARNIGGDFYDVVEIGPDDIFFVLGDVSGKGIPAALVMAQTLSLLRLVLAPGLTPSEALRRLNAALAERELRRMFITAILGRFQPSTGRVDFASAGHPPPLHKQTGGRAVPAACESAPPLAVLPDMEFPANSVCLQSGEALVFFSDGLSESFSGSREMFGPEGIAAHIQGPETSAAKLLEHLVAGEETHRGNSEPTDDLAILVIKKL